jgi:hypothetical protein
MEQIAKHIPYADAAWLRHRLAMLSDDQVRPATPIRRRAFSREPQMRRSAADA